MEHPLTVAARVSRNPHELYEKAFGYFQELFNLRPSQDMAKVELLGHLPDFIYEDRSRLNPVITGALWAMLERRSRIEGDPSDPREGIALSAIPDYVRFRNIADVVEDDLDVEESLDRELLRQRGDAVVVIKSIKPPLPPWVERLDGIICIQGKICGQDLLESELVRNRVRYWERCDYPKYKRFLHALDRFAKVQQRLAIGRNEDPLRRLYRDKTVEQLRIAKRKLKAKFQERRAERDSAEDELEIIAWAEEATKDPDVTFLGENQDRWLEFVRSNPLHFKKLVMYGSAEKLDDELMAFAKNKKSANHLRRTTSQS
jgi:hypothetical protein